MIILLKERVTTTVLKERRKHHHHPKSFDKKKEKYTHHDGANKRRKKHSPERRRYHHDKKVQRERGKYTQRHVSCSPIMKQRREILVEVFYIKGQSNLLLRATTKDLSFFYELLEYVTNLRPVLIQTGTQIVRRPLGDLVELY